MNEWRYGAEGAFERVYPGLAARLGGDGGAGGAEADGAWDALPDEPSSPAEQARVIRALPMRLHRPDPAAGVCVILAGGRGSRMGNGVPQKTLSPIGGRPAILRLIETCRGFGVEDFVVVTGVGYRHVVEALRDEPANISFVYQHRAGGTGHAARLAARYLAQQDYGGRVLAIMGDKWIKPAALERILSEHADANADLTLAAGRKADWPDAGRLVIGGDGRVRAVLEKPDIVLMRALADFYDWPRDPVPCRDFLARMHSYWDRPAKLRTIAGEAFWNQLHSMESIPKTQAALPNHPPDCRFRITETLSLGGAEAEERCDLVNLSVYAFSAPALYESAESLKADNAQGELYLTDAVQYLASSFNGHAHHVRAALTDDPNGIMGFNTPEELERIERMFTEARTV